MRKMYVIQWKSKVNGRAGRGTKAFDRDEGEQLVEELNQEYPDIHHELLAVEKVGVPPGAEAAAVEPGPEGESGEAVVEDEVHSA